MAPPSRRRAVLGLLSAAIGAARVSPGLAASGPGAAPLLTGLDGHAHPVASRHALARRYVRQGVMLTYGFNPQEAVRSLEAAVVLDPSSVEAWWALAWALGPNINADMAPGAQPRVMEAIDRARKLAAPQGGVLRDLADALALRHPQERGIDEESYAQALQGLSRRHSRHAWVQLLAAEALMNLHPYDWWQADGSPQPWTPTLGALLRRSLALDPRQPGAHHYWIHLQESSPHPERARASADFLRTAYPGSGHLLHMPAHIDLRTGHLAEAIEANQRAIAADRAYLAQVDAQGAYRVGYVAHNHHFLWAAAAMAGRQALAWQAATLAWPAACGPSARDGGLAVVQHYSVLPLFTRVRFGQWRELLLNTAPPDGNLAYPRAIWHFARGMAQANLGQARAAQDELDQLREARGAPELGAVKIKNINLAERLVGIAELTLRAAMASVAVRLDDAVDSLRQATAIEDGLEYDEPHLWLAPTRHALGAALLAAGRFTEAVEVYRQDLRHYVDNGWSLSGMAVALDGLRRGDEAQRFRAAARRAFDGAEALPQGSGF